MARNSVQFQKSMSEPQFQQLYGTEEQCEEALRQWRWPDGFVCPRCQHDRAYDLSTRAQYECTKCHTQTSLTAGTIFQSTKLPLTLWFRTIYHLTQSKNGVSILELSRRLGVSYNTAWKLKHKLMQVMMERDDDRCQLGGRIEMDDAYLGGERSGTTGRGAEGKLPFIAAVETTDDGRPIKMILHPVDGFTWAEVVRFAQKNLHGSAHVYSDGLACFTGVIEAGCTHTPIVCGSGRQAAQNPTFRWVNTILGNVKNAMLGTYRHFSHKHAARYLAEFQYRFNRRFQLADMIARLAYVSLRTPAMPYRLLKLTEART